MCLQLCCMPRWWWSQCSGCCWPQVDESIGAVVVGWDPRFSYSRLVYASVCLRELKGEWAGLLLHIRPCVLGYTLTRVTHSSDRDLVPLASCT